MPRSSLAAVPPRTPPDTQPPHRSGLFFHSQEAPALPLEARTSLFAGDNIRMSLQGCFKGRARIPVKSQELLCGGDRTHEAVLLLSLSVPPGQLLSAPLRGFFFPTQSWEANAGCVIFCLFLPLELSCWDETHQAFSSDFQELRHKGRS